MCNLLLFLNYSNKLYTGWNKFDTFHEIFLHILWFSAKTSLVSILSCILKNVLCHLERIGAVTSFWKYFQKHFLTSITVVMFVFSNKINLRWTTWRFFVLKFIFLLNWIIKNFSRNVEFLKNVAIPLCRYWDDWDIDVLSNKTLFLTFFKV